MKYVSPLSTVSSMKYLDVDGVGRVSRIGLGTWQFGSREWGYGDGYASGAAGDIVRRARALRGALVGPRGGGGAGKKRADPRRGTRRRAGRGRGGQQGLSGRSLPRRDQAARARKC